MDAGELIHAAQRRLRLGGAIAGLAAGLVAVAASTALGGLIWGRAAPGAALGVVAAVGLAVVAARRAAVRWTPAATAAHIELLTPGLDNLLVTATDLSTGVIDASDRMRAEIVRQASDRVSTLRLPDLAPVAGPLWMVVAIAVGALAVVWAGWSTVPERPPLASGPAPGGPRLQSLRVTMTPPAYLGRDAEQLENPDHVAIPAGGRLRLELETTSRLAWLETAGTEPVPMAATGDGQFHVEWTPAGTTAIAVATGDSMSGQTESRVLQVTVVPDQSPVVRIAEPGKDLAFATAPASLDLMIEATDAEGLAAVRVAYVRASGSGESFAFEEGDVPVTLERVDARRWRGRARLPLSALKLDDGDSLVYRALVRDTNPDGEWMSSDAFTVDVGRRLEFAGAGFAIPDEDRRYAISQQMVIVKTEQAQAERPKLSEEEWTERMRFLAMEQRMVRAEVVFLSGGEVVDEVEEAEHSHELQEGRLENTGRAEMLKAINEMSRAEAHLNDGDSRQALVAERSALAALQRAFDRRRYFLRTLSERSRIDPTRRLTGNRAEAQSQTRALPESPPADTTSLRALLQDLAAVAEHGEPVPAALVARLASVDPGAEEWRRIAAALAAAATAAERQEASREAMARLAELGRARSGASAPAPMMSPLAGWWSEEQREGRRP